NTAPTETYFFNGDIDEVQVFDRALNPSEVSALWQGSESGFYETRYFDSLGRTTQVLRRDLFSSFVASDSRTYDFQDRVLTDTIRRTSTTSYVTTFTYDFAGRPSSALYPGTAQPLTLSYDDANRIRTAVAENG